MQGFKIFDLTLNTVDTECKFVRTELKYNQ